MKVNFFNAVRQTISEQREDEKKRQAWIVIKWVIRIAILVWKVLRFFIHECWHH